MADELDIIFGACANQKRRNIIDTLAYRPATISQLAREQQLSLPAIYKHLRILEEAKLIQRKKVGRTNFVAFRRAHMKLAQDWLLQYNTAWGSDQGTLENYIASLQDRT